MQATCLADMAHVLRDQGALDQADDHYRQALAAFRFLEDATGMAGCLKGLSEVAKQRGDLEAAVSHLAQARSWYERAGARAYVGYCLNSLGDLYRLRGALPQAEDHYRRALGRLERAGAGAVAIVNVNLGLVLVERERYAQAGEVFRARLATAEAAGWRQMEGALHTCLLPCVAAARQWEAWDHHLDRATALLADTSFLDVDIARMAGRAGDLATRLDEPERAAAALHLALAQWTGLERSAEAERVRQALGVLGA